MSEIVDVTREKLLKQIVDKLTAEDLLRMISDLSSNEIKKLSRLMTIATFFDSDLLRTFALEYLALNVSKKRMGRFELVKVSQNIAMMQGETLKERFRDKIRRFFS